MSKIEARFDRNVITGETLLVVTDEHGPATFQVHPGTPMPSEDVLRKMLATAGGDDAES